MTIQGRSGQRIMARFFGKFSDKALTQRQN